jgi:hypothetical protein
MGGRREARVFAAFAVGVERGDSEWELMFQASPMTRRGWLSATNKVKDGLKAEMDRCMFCGNEMLPRCVTNHVDTRPVTCDVSTSFAAIAFSHTNTMVRFFLQKVIAT